MSHLNGKISDRLRSMFTTDQILHNPHPDRSASPTPKKLPKHVEGIQVGKADRKKK